LSTDNNIQQLAEALSSRAVKNNHRQLLLVSGERTWISSQMEVLDLLSIRPSLKKDSVLWVGDSASVDYLAITNQQYSNYLGCEFEFVIYDCFSGFDANAFAALCGTLKGGGLLILLTPPLLDWPDFTDPEYSRMAVYPFEPEQISGRFLKRLINVLANDPQVVIAEQDKPWPEIESQKTVAQVRSQQFQQQQSAIADIIHVVKGHRRRPLVIQSDRGRGKSAALGLAAASLIEQGAKKILLTAPKLANVETVFHHAQLSLPESLQVNASLTLGQSSLIFIAVDELIRGDYKADLLMVDEAAAIPTAMLTQLLKRYSRIVFATTVHGYEGTGRGFHLRFKQVLDALTPQWKEIELTDPIRWAPSDPLETVLFKSLLLDASASVELSGQPIDLQQCRAQRLDRDMLASDEKKLSEIFGLLVLAHYQTSPADLRNLLDGPNIQVWSLEYQGQIVATALLADEGGFDKAMSQCIWQGERRPRGHLIAQSLSVHGGFKEAPLLRGLRVMRIAVHPGLQRQGLGCCLMQHINESARSQGFDWIGSSFAATEDVLPFWQRAGLLPVRVGVSKDTSSGTFSAMVLGGLSEAGNNLFTLANTRFSEQLPYQLSDSIRSISPSVVCQLLESVTSVLKMDDQDWQDVRSFSLAYRVYDVCSVALFKFICLYVASMCKEEVISVQQRDALILKVIQKHNWKITADQLGLTGRKQVISLLQQSVATMLEKISKY
jgi:tRNA(Met) cytidine acetyltransferase